MRIKEKITCYKQNLQFYIAWVDSTQHFVMCYEIYSNKEE